MAQGSSSSRAYAAGFLANGAWDLFGVAVPLYAVALGASASEIGWLVGARAVLPLVFALQAGRTMDRLGVRPLLIVFALASTLVALAYPITTQFPVLLALQLLSGLAAELSWSSTQTLINALSQGELLPLARFGFYSRLGSMTAPLVVGVTCDFGGALATFLIIAAWNGLLVAHATTLPRARGVTQTPFLSPQAPQRPANAPASRCLRTQTLALLALPPIATVTALSFLRNTPAAMQGSLYIVVLESAGYTGTVIGILIALSELSAAAGSLLAMRVPDRIAPAWTAAAAVASAILFMTITPLISSVLIALTAAAVLRGLAQGINQPILSVIVAREAGNQQGLALGLRTTSHRLATMLLPVLAGTAAEAWDLETAFFAIGIATITLCYAAPIFLFRERRGA